MNFYVKILLNGVKREEIDLEKFFAWIEYFTPLKVEFDILETHFSLKYKDFILGNPKGRGLDGIKDQVRSSVQKSAYNAVFFFYKPSPEELDKLSAWTYPNPLSSGDAFVEIPIDPSYGDRWPLQASTHEVCHAFHRICWFSGKATKDTMDLYDQDDNPDSADGNRARNLREVSPYWPLIAQKPATVKILESLLALLQLLISMFAGPRKSGLVRWAEAIKKYEGWFPGSRSQKNNNPGNLKYAQQPGSTGLDPEGFAVFSSYEFGFNALIHQLDIASNDIPTDSLYSADMTLTEFFRTYAPGSDGNEPDAYALFVARELEVSQQTRIGDIRS